MPKIGGVVDLLFSLLRSRLLTVTEMFLCDHWQAHTNVCYNKYHIFEQGNSIV
jgi:hypothetical protein